MANVSGTYSSVYNQNVLRNIFQPAYSLCGGEFQARIDTNLPGNVEIGNSNTNYTFFLNGEAVATALSVSSWSTYPATSLVNMANYSINNISSLAVGKSSVSSSYSVDVSGSIICSSNIVSSGNVVAGGSITTGIGNLTIPQGNIVVASGNVVILGALNATTSITTSDLICSGNISNLSSSSNSIGGVTLENGIITPSDISLPSANPGYYRIGGIMHQWGYNSNLLASGDRTISFSPYFSSAPEVVTFTSGTAVNLGASWVKFISSSNWTFSNATASSVNIHWQAIGPA